MSSSHLENLLYETYPEVKGWPIEFAPEAIDVEVEMKHWKGSQIGEACHCAVARGANDVPHVVGSAVGAHMAYLAFDNRVIYYYTHDGAAAKGQDEKGDKAVGVLGTHRLHVPRPSERRGKSRRGTGKGTSVPKRGYRLSMAAKMRARV